MLKMILRVPRNFDAEYFCHVVTALVNDGKEDYDCTDYDLGDCVTGRDNLRAMFDGEFEYEIDADLIDLETIEVIQSLQKICPAVQFYFEDSGYDKNAIIDDDEFYRAELYYEPCYRNEVKQFRHSV